jgi:hypothetical protein
VQIHAKPDKITPLCLYIPPLQIAVQYTGRLITTAPGAAPLIAAVSVAEPAVKGILVLDHTSVSQTVLRGTQPSFSVALSEKTGSIALTGVSVRLEQISSSPDSGFDLEKNIKFRLNGQRVYDLDHYPPKGGDTRDRTIPPGGKSQVIITLRALKPGDYAGILRFTANNSGSDDAQKFQINVHVRDPLWRAVVFMIIALAISLAATKVVTYMRRRASLLQQISTLQRPWFSSLPLSPPGVRVKAVLHQAQRLSRHFWLTSPDLIEENVNNVRSMVDVLDRVHQLRQQLAERVRVLFTRF